MMMRYDDVMGSFKRTECQVRGETCHRSQDMFVVKDVIWLCSGNTKYTISCIYTHLIDFQKQCLT